MLIAPPCGYQGVYLRPRIDGDQRHCACISQDCHLQILCQVIYKWPQSCHNAQLDDIDCTNLWLSGGVFAPQS